jgi:hypothetical protein
MVIVLLQIPGDVFLSVPAGCDTPTSRLLPPSSCDGTVRCSTSLPTRTLAFSLSAFGGLPAGFRFLNEVPALDKSDPSGVQQRHFPDLLHPFQTSPSASSSPEVSVSRSEQSPIIDLFLDRSTATARVGLHEPSLSSFALPSMHGTASTRLSFRHPAHEPESGL